MRLFAMLIIAGLSLAGCAGLPTPDFTLEATGVPENIAVGEAFTFTLTATGTGPFETDHIGAHWWATAPADPTAGLSDSTGCAHQEGSLPGTFDVTCTITHAGTVTLHGHARVTDEHDGESHKHEFWTEPFTVHAHPGADAFQLTTDGIPENATVGEPFSFTLEVASDATADTDHIGAHYWFGEMPEDPTAQVADSVGCEHQEGSLPGMFTVTCTVEDAGTVYVLGHARITMEAMKHDYWAEGQMVTVA